MNRVLLRLGGDGCGFFISPPTALTAVADAVIDLDTLVSCSDASTQAAAWRHRREAVKR